jgi:predicted nucleotidyltransferase
LGEVVLDREALKAEIHAVLEQEPRLVFAYLYGSFCREEPFQDIDIGVYADSDVNPYVFSADLKERLSAHLRDGPFDLPADRFDVQVLNQAPFTFLKRMFREGILMIDRNPDLRTDIIEHVSRKYRECAGLLMEASLL